MTKFRNRDGTLTRYALACGYIEQGTGMHGSNVTMWMEHGYLHVRAHDHEEGIRREWATFETLKEARAAYQRMLRGY